MGIKAIYQEGVFKPLKKIKGIKEGEQVEISIERNEWNNLAMLNHSFKFLKDEPNIYTKADVIKNK